MKLVRKLREAFEEAKKRDRSFERALHFRAAMLRLEEELFEALASKENKDTTKWYNCPRCDAGYPDQECVCEESEE